MTSARIRPCMGTVEFNGNVQEVLDYLQKGYSIKMIHEILQKENKITMSYYTFTHKINQYLQKERNL